MDPVLPGYAIGVGDDVTGFRSWLDHLIGLWCILLLGFFITSMVAVKQLFRSILAFSFFFAVIALIFMFIPSMALTQILKTIGVTTGEFSSGWRRFLFLPTMGQFMIVGCLLPSLFATTRPQKAVLLILGIASVIAGGNRGSALALLVITGTIWMLKRKPAAVIALIACSLGLILLANVIVKQGWGRTLTPWTRVMSAFSPSLSTDIGATGTIEWRIARWRRASEDIRTHPWFGMGYGGVRGYFRMMSNITDSDPDLEIERDVATGLTHNGYVSSARALGIPVTVIFILIMAARIRTHIKQAKRHRNGDAAFFEGHVFLCSYFVMMLFMLMFAAEIRYPTLWMFIALSLILERLKPDEPAGTGETLNTDATARAQTPALPIARFF
jgi:O-antigen ligase